MASLKRNNNIKMILCESCLMPPEGKEWIFVSPSEHCLFVYFFNHDQITENSCNLRLKEYAFRFLFLHLFSSFKTHFLTSLLILWELCILILLTPWSPISFPHPCPPSQKKIKQSKQANKGKTNKQTKNSANKIKTKPTTKTEKSL